MKTGLTLGKFAPLHRGHQLVIERALAECERTIVLVYDAPETTPIPLPVRAGWIRRLYPCVEVVEAWDGPTDVGDTPDVTRRHDEYLISRFGGRGVTHFFSSEFYGAHVSKALGAVDCRVDPARLAVPVSGTAIRSNPFAHRQFLHPLVYRDLIVWVVFLGAPSTGKSTLAAAAAREFSTVFVPEFGREYWERHQVDRRLSLEQLVEIAEGHRASEDVAAVDANRFLFVDTDATTTSMFSRYYHGAVHPQLEELAAETTKRYDLFFLCEDDIPYDDTPDRSGQVHRASFQREIRADLIQRRIPFVTLKGTVEQRLQIVQSILARFEEWRSIGDCFCSRP